MSDPAEPQSTHTHLDYLQPPALFPGDLGGTLALPTPDPVMWVLGLDLKWKQQCEHLEEGSSPTTGVRPLALVPNRPPHTTPG